MAIRLDVVEFKISRQALSCEGRTVASRNGLSKGERCFLYSAYGVFRIKNRWNGGTPVETDLVKEANF